MTVVGEAFDRGRAVTVEQLARRLALPIRTAGKLGEHLHSEDLLHRVEGDIAGNPGYMVTAWRFGRSRSALTGCSNSAGSLTVERQNGPQVPGRERLANLCDAKEQAAHDTTLVTVLSREGP